MCMQSQIMIKFAKKIIKRTISESKSMSIIHILEIHAVNWGHERNKTEIQCRKVLSCIWIFKKLTLSSDVYNISFVYRIM